MIKSNREQVNFSHRKRSKYSIQVCKNTAFEDMVYVLFSSIGDDMANQSILALYYYSCILSMMFFIISFHFVDLSLSYFTLHAASFAGFGVLGNSA